MLLFISFFLLTHVLPGCLWALVNIYYEEYLQSLFVQDVFSEKRFPPPLPEDA